MQSVFTLYSFFPTPFSDGEGYSEILFATSPVMHTVRPTFYKGIVFRFFLLIAIETQYCKGLQLRHLQSIQWHVP